MTPKERVIRALKREGPDKVPRELSFGAFTPELMEVFKEKTGSDDPAEYFNFEVRSLNFKIPPETDKFVKYHTNLPEGARIDEWGTARVRGSMYHYEHYIFPMEKFESPYEVEEYPLPDFLKPEYHSHSDLLFREKHRPQCWFRILSFWRYGNFRHALLFPEQLILCFYLLICSFLFG